jgi:hypothetical protein
MTETPETTALEPASEVLPPAVSGEILRDLATRIVEAVRLATLDLTLEIGKMIVHDLYQDDLANWRSRGVKDASFGKLAEIVEPHVSRATLQRAVAIFDLTQRLGVSSWKNLGSSHLRAVLGLPDQDQKRLLGHADRNNWTVARLEEEAHKARDASSEPSRAGRPPLPRFIKTLHRLCKCTQEPDESFGDLDAIDAMEPDEIRGLFDAVTAVRVQCAMLEEKLQSRMASAQG